MSAQSYERETASHAFRLDPTYPGVVHETRPDDVVESVVYTPEGATEITWTDGLQVVATGYGRRTRLEVTALDPDAAAEGTSSLSRIADPDDIDEVLGGAA